MVIEVHTKEGECFKWDSADKLEVSEGMLEVHADFDMHPFDIPEIKYLKVQ